MALAGAVIRFAHQKFLGEHNPGRFVISRSKFCSISRQKASEDPLKISWTWQPKEKRHFESMFDLICVSCGQDEQGYGINTAC
jgi:hypothetical protein